MIFQRFEEFGRSKNPCFFEVFNGALKRFPAKRFEALSSKNQERKNRPWRHSHSIFRKEWAFRLSELSEALWGLWETCLAPLFDLNSTMQEQKIMWATAFLCEQDKNRSAPFFGNGPNTVSESTVPKTELSEFFGAHWVPGSEFSEFLSAYDLCAQANSPSFTAELTEFAVKLSEAQWVLSSETVLSKQYFRPFPHFCLKLYKTRYMPVKRDRTLSVLKNPRNGQHPERDRNEIRGHKGTRQVSISVHTRISYRSARCHETPQKRDMRLENEIGMHFGNKSETFRWPLTPSIFPKVLPYKWGAYCSTMGGVLLGFPFCEA